MKINMLRLAAALIWLSFIGGLMEMSLQTAFITNVWIYSLFLFQGLAAVTGACVILFLKEPT